MKDAVPSLGTLNFCSVGNMEPLRVPEDAFQMIYPQVHRGLHWHSFLLLVHTCYARVLPPIGMTIPIAALRSHLRAHSLCQQSRSSHGGLTRDCQLGQAPFRGSVYGRGRDPLNPELGPGSSQLPAHTGGHCCCIIPICNNTDGLGGHCAK